MHPTFLFQYFFHLFLRNAAQLAQLAVPFLLLLALLLFDGSTFKNKYLQLVSGAGAAKMLLQKRSIL